MSAKCATVGCKNEPTEEITYTWPGDRDEQQKDKVCTPCAESYERRPALKATRVPIAVRYRLEYLRGELRAECISQGELIELQSLAKYIEPGDRELLEAAGVPEGEDATRKTCSCGEAFADEPGHDNDNT
jgi:hypothetical protein